MKDFGGDVIAANRVPEPFRAEEYAVRNEGNRDQEARLIALPGQMEDMSAIQAGRWWRMRA